MFPQLNAPTFAPRKVLLPIALVLVAAAILVAAPAKALGQVTADWPAAKVKRGSSVSVTGKVTGLDLGDAVFLQQKVLGGWRSVAKAELGDDREYKLPIPTWWLGERTYRVKSGSLLNTGILGATSSSWTVKVVPTYDAVGDPDSHTWTSSTYMRWNPCQPIGFRVNINQAPNGALADMKEAMKRIGQASGLKFVYRGTTDGIPQSGGNSWYPADTQIVVAWIRKSQSSMFNSYPTAAAVGGAVSSGGFQQGDDTTISKIIRGAVVIDKTMNFRGGFGKGYTRGDILLHELGHTMGLGHVGASKQIMYGRMTRGAARLNKGDLTGMEKRGARLGCVTPVQFRTTTEDSDVSSTPVMHLNR
jgi:hypothetical protein